MLADVPLATWVLDRDTLAFHTVNDAALAQYGLERDEIVGLATTDIWPGDGLRRVLDMLDEPGSLVQSSGPWRHRHRRGHLIDVLVSARSAEWEGNSVVVIVAEDVTAQRLEDARLRTSEQRLHLLGQLAAGVAHDLNQSLALISGYGELALQALTHCAPDVASLDEYVSIMRQAATDSGETVRRLLTFARGNEAGQAQVVDVAGLLREVAALTAPRWRNLPEAEGRPIRLELDIDGSDDAMTVMGWPASLREALTNLIFNAVDALPRGGTIRLAGRHRVDGIEIEVADDGIGMTTEVRERIFEPFFTTKGERGTGLGLAQVLGIVGRHGGHVDVESTVGRGTTCRLVLPSTFLEENGARGTMAGDAQPGRRLRILVVEDLPPLACLLARMIERRGHLVVTVESAEAALERLANFHFDVVISDLGLGMGLNGWELAEQVQARWPGLPFGLATGWAATIDPADALGRGILAILAKPFKSGDLLRFLERFEGASGAGRPAESDTEAGRRLAADAPYETIGRRPVGSAAPPRPARTVLTPRQYEVLELVARGLTNRAIAETIGVSGSTVKTHVDHILTKLNVADRTQAAVRAVELGLIQVSADRGASTSR
jgi:PAS domain S-box-containing protein